MCYVSLGSSGLWYALLEPWQDDPVVGDDYEEQIDNFVLRSYLNIYNVCDDPEKEIQPELILKFLLESIKYYGQNENILKDVRDQCGHYQINLT